MGPVGGRGFVGSVKFADGKTSSANVPHLNVWGFDISAAEFSQPKKTRVFGVNRPSWSAALSDQSRTLFPSRFVRARAFTPKKKNAGSRINTRAMIGLYVIMC